MLYYVCDSDGDTIIYNEKDISDQYTIKEKVTPKQGRVVLFDGSLYHTAEQPLNNNRCIVNYDLE
jgi:ectoine hydroxylase-related dioxygenase (phytanoyl-CoA dioxygenase family)